MATTTVIGTWTTLTRTTYGTLRDDLASILGEHANDTDREQVEATYRERINTALPAGVTLAGDEFIADTDTDVAPEQVTDAVESVDLYAIIEAHDTPAS